MSPFTSFLLKKTDDGPSFKTNRGLATWPKVNLEGKFYFFSNESSLIIYAWTVMNINQDSLPSLGFNMGHPELHLYYTSALLKRSRIDDAML